jgi:hypothetical protein
MSWRPPGRLRAGPAADRDLIADLLGRTERIRVFPVVAAILAMGGPVRSGE